MDFNKLAKDIVNAVTEHADEVLAIAGAGPGIIAVATAATSVVKLIDKVKDTLELPSDQIGKLEDKRVKLARVMAHADRTAASLE